MSNASDTVENLKRLLGEPVVFIRWPRGVKGTRRKWRHLTIADMTPEYLSKLPEGNIGVALGEKSGGLCHIDWDVEEFVQPFLEANPQLSGTLRTRGSRGAGLWIRFSGTYPPRTVKLKTFSGREAGEFRSNGSQSIISGIHPNTNQPYQFLVEKPVITTGFDSLRWPPEIANPFKSTECTEETEETEVTEEPKSCTRGGRLFHSTINCVEDAFRVSLPTKKRENNQYLFNLARAILTLQMKGQHFDLAQRKSIFDKWYKRAEPFLREGRSKEEYYLEFMNACQRARYPLGGVKVAEAWQRATSQPLPVEARTFENPKFRLLIAFLREMQAMSGTEPFYITSRACADMLEQDGHSTAYKWLGALTTMGYIKVAERGTEHRATRYYYIWSVETNTSENGV